MIRPDRIPAAIAAQHAAMVECALMSGERDKAIAAVHRAFAESAQTASELTVDSEVEFVANPRVTGILETHSIFTIGDLIQRSANELAAIPQLSWRTIEVIQAKLADHGFQLGADPT